MSNKNIPQEKRLLWAEAEPFNPLSPKQVLDYLKFRGYKIPKHRTKKTPTTDEESLEKLNITVQDPLLEACIDLRHISKAKSYLTDKYVGRDGRIHALFTTFPKTGRLSAQRP